MVAEEVVVVVVTLAVAVISRVRRTPAQGVRVSISGIVLVRCGDLAPVDSCEKLGALAKVRL
jgi:hypothetical protein